MIIAVLLKGSEVEKERQGADFVMCADSKMSAIQQTEAVWLQSKQKRRKYIWKGHGSE